MEKTTFTINEAEATMVVERTFSAPREHMWEAWTTSEGLEGWWAPLPWKAVTKSFDFSAGGHWHYYMAGPNGEKEWCMERYETIIPYESFTATDEFCDEEGNVNPALPSNHWHTQFLNEGDGTKIVVTTTYASVEDLKKILEMGMKEGFTMALDQLEQLLA